MIHQLYVNMISRSSLLLEGYGQDSHRHIWFVDPALLKQPLELGDEVQFLGPASEIIIRTRVVTLGLRPEDFPKFCSSINSVGLRWEEIT